MANQFKAVWVIVFLLVAGGAMFLLSQKQQSTPVQGVVLQDIFTQPAKSEEKSKDPIPALAIVTSPENGHEAGWTIQVYSFQDKNRADKALTNLKTKGYNAFMIVSELGEKGTWYRVRVGSIPDESAAHKILEDIRRSYNSGFIVKPMK